MSVCDEIFGLNGKVILYILGIIILCVIILKYERLDYTTT